MKRSQLQELIRHITRAVVKEYISTSSSSDESNPPEVVSVDSLSPAEQAKLNREKEIQRRDLLKQKEKELDVTKREQDFQKQKVDQSKRFAVPNLTKDIQRLKGAKI